jgi:hypothetical protein
MSEDAGNEGWRTSGSKILKLTNCQFSGFIVAICNEIFLDECDGHMDLTVLQVNTHLPFTQKPFTSTSKRF